MRKNYSALLFSLVCIVTSSLLVNFEDKNVMANQENRVYLSDLSPYSKSIGYGSLKIDTNMSGGQISYLVDGTRTYFLHGLTAHATSTLIYDIGENHNYDYFSTYMGVDASQAGAGEVKFSFYTSTNLNNWTTVVTPTIKKSSDNAIKVLTDVSSVRYLKFVFDSNGGNGNDHSGLGNPLLYNKDNLHSADATIKPVEFYDERLANKHFDTVYETNKLDLLQRMFIDLVDYDSLKEAFLDTYKEQENRALINWLYNNEIALEEFLVGGNPDGSYINALNVLSSLYKEYKNDLNDTTSLFSPETGSNRTRGDLYRTMMFAIALTHADGGPHMWLDGVATSDPLNRYAQYKKTYLEGLLRNDVFENLNVEEMRYVMGGRGHNDEIYWLNKYTRLMTPNASYPGLYSPHRFLKYGKDWDYTGKGYKKEENFSKYDEKYHLTEFGVPFSNYNHLWMVFEGSHICWGISYAGTNFANSFGVPSHYNRQPGHAAFFVYNKTADNKTTWSIDNNISGWTQTWFHEDVVGYSHDRVMCNWGSIGNGWSTYNNATYLPLASTALDNYQDYAKAEVLMSLEKLAIKENRQEQLYRKVLDILPYHLDANEKLTRYYVENKTNEQIAALAEDIASEMYYFPLPMVDLLNILKAKLSSIATADSLTQLARVDSIQRTYLLKGTLSSEDASARNLLAQTDICKTEANYLLNNASTQLATFSFDGDNSCEIVFSEQYKNIRYRYSLDGGINWSSTFTTTDDNLKHEFSDIEIALINADKDILIWLEGWTSSLENNAPDPTLAYKIDILEGSLPSGLEQNDNEDRFLGNVTNMEYSLDGTTYFDLSNQTKFPGNQIVKTRRKRNGTTLEGPIKEFTFTASSDETRSYIPMSRLTYVNCSSEEISTGDNASHVIDGLTSTRWHTLWKGGDSERYVTIKLDSETYLSGLDYLPVGGNGTCYSANVLVSRDGIKWTIAKTVTGWGNNSTKKSISFEPILATYVRFQGINTVGGFCSARLLEFFEYKSLLDKNIEGISVTHQPALEYFTNSKLSLTDLEVSLNLSGGGSVRIPTDLLTINEVDMTSPGDKTVTISYGSYSTSLTIHVLDISDCNYYTNGGGYNSFSDALNAADSGGTIYVMRDLTLDSTLIINKNISIDGNGHTLTRGNSLTNGYLINVQTDKQLTLTNVELSGGAIWSGEQHSVLHRGTQNNGISSTYGIISLVGTAKLYLNSKSVLKDNYHTGTTGGQAGGAIRSTNTSYIEVNGGIIKNIYSEVFGSAMYLYNSSTLVFNSGLVQGCSGNADKNACVICNDLTSNVTIKGGEFVYNCGSNNNGGVFWTKSGTLTINGGTFKNNVAPRGNTIFVANTGTVVINDFNEIEEVFLTSNTKVKFTSSLTNKYILLNSAVKTDGTIIAEFDTSINLDELLLALDYKDKMIVGSASSIKIDSTSLAAVEHSRNGKITYYDSFEGAYDVSKDGDRITLLEDVELANDFILDKQIEIDLGSNQFTGEGSLLTADGMEILIEDSLIKISSHSHQLIQITYEWNDDFTQCVATAICQCGEVITEEAIITSSISIEATTENGEYTTYKATFFNSAFETQIKENIQTSGPVKFNKNTIFSDVLTIGGLTFSLLFIFGILYSRRRRKNEEKENLKKK